MDFELSEQQLAFRDLMRDFARKSIAPVAREWELAGRYPGEIVDEMKAMGLFGMLVPEAYGGIAIDAVSYSLVFEEISKAWMGIAGILLFWRNRPTAAQHVTYTQITNFTDSGKTLPDLPSAGIRGLNDAEVLNYTKVFRGATIIEGWDISPGP